MYTCTCFSDQLLDITSGNIIFQIVYSQKLCFLRLPFAFYDMFFVCIYAVCYVAINVFICLLHTLVNFKMRK